MARQKEVATGHVLLINLTPVPIPDGYLHLDQAIVTLPGFDAGSSCMLLQGAWIQLSMLHPATTPSAVTGNNFTGLDLEFIVLNMQDLFGYIVVFCSPVDIRRLLPALVVASSRLRKPVVFVSNQVDSATANLSSALNMGASQIVGGVVTAGISVVIEGKMSQVI